MSIRLILGDQLSHGISSLRDLQADDRVLMCEVRQEATYVPHHKKKIAFIFSAMRHFAQELRAQGRQVDYVAYDDPANTGNLGSELARLCKAQPSDRVILTEPGEYRLLAAAKQWSEQLGIPVEIREDDRFLASHQDFANWAQGRKQLRMEYFYREMRKRSGYLTNGKDPVGGQWNFDKDNRQSPPPGLKIPAPFKVTPDPSTEAVIALVEQTFSEHFGALDDFHYAVTRADALRALQHFIDHNLPRFGDYQDAMLQNESWMFHSHISLYLNVGLLLPGECIEAAEHALQQDQAPINAVEGFIRQILGWREYVRGLYWQLMPEYAERNALAAERPLPDFYWTADTQMNCLRDCIETTRQHAYAHHIQRLMVLGNFALLAGLDPRAVSEWYLLVYADAFEWVELPNVSGMALFADGGVLASKPYAASGAYIDRMSDYCGDCRYKVKQKNGPNACPFNYLYWDFLERQKDRLQANPRLGMPYRTLNNMSQGKRAQIAEDARTFFARLDKGQV